MLSHRAELNAFLTSSVTTAQYFLVPRYHLLPAMASRAVEMKKRTSKIRLVGIEPTPYGTPCISRQELYPLSQGGRCCVIDMNDLSITLKKLQSKAAIALTSKKKVSYEREKQKKSRNIKYTIKPTKPHLQDVSIKASSPLPPLQQQRTYIQRTKRVFTYTKLKIRAVEVGLVLLALVVWAGAIALFFNRWGKIRMLLPYQPDFKDQLKVPGTGVCNSSNTGHNHSTGQPTCPQIDGLKTPTSSQDHSSTPLPPRSQRASTTHRTVLFRTLSFCFTKHNKSPSDFLNNVKLPFSGLLSNRQLNVVDVEGADDKAFDRILEKAAKHLFMGLINAFSQAP
ncbi:unnamed protein product [Trichogramma brassicae]|uniref:Fibronectin type III domain-containing protein n=1 Tax=Trichogramma brassicae TaxID=86971 RepID=A0A6H5IXN6_9HYME|nr:unnamed protein product [Trichogramma brassicae]